ncbi:MAG: radical SAM protein [Spirochaetes bacterium]|nr:radical SAM protein [Spirochaetota bacterium]MBU0954511.1 radical SAM protein [Spirochaetota bacterium]
MKKLLLIQSTPYAPDGSLVKKKRLYFVGLGLPLLAALSPADWDIQIVLETIEEIPFDSDADLVAIGSMGHAVIRSLDIAAEFRRRGKTVVLGGYMVSLMPEEAQKYADAVVVGDAEAVWPRLLADFEAGKLAPLYQEELLVLDPPPPRFDLILKKPLGDFLPVQAGRGCPNSCSFCSVFCLYHGRYLKRPIEAVLRDILQVKALGFRKFLLLDDNIAADRTYFIALCRQIQPLHMQWFSQCSIEIAKDAELLAAVAASGCIGLSFGLESISEQSLLDMNKAWAKPAEYAELLSRIRMAGIDLSSEMVVGADGDTLESIRATAAFIEQNRIVVPRFYILTPIPGTLYHAQLKKAGRLYKHDMYQYNGSEAVHIPANMSPEELTEAYWDLYKQVFTLRSIIRRTLLRRQALLHPLRALFYLSINIFYRWQIKRHITPNII